MILEASRITCDHRVSQSASHLTNHTPIACITYHSTTLLLSHITHHASHHTSCMGATRCLPMSQATADPRVRFARGSAGRRYPSRRVVSEQRERVRHTRAVALRLSACRSPCVYSGRTRSGVRPPVVSDSRWWWWWCGNVPPPQWDVGGSGQGVKTDLARRAAPRSLTTAQGRPLRNAFSQFSQSPQWNMPLRTLSTDSLSEHTHF